VVMRGRAARALFDALLKTDGRSGEVELLAELVFEETFIAEMQAANLIREKHESRRGHGSLRDVINFNFAAGWRSAAVQIDSREPAIEFASGHAALARGHDLVDQRKKPASAFTRERGEKNDGRIIEELQLFVNQFLIVAHQLHGIESGFFGLGFFFSGGAILRGFESEVPFIDDDDKRAAG